MSRRPRVLALSGCLALACLVVPATASAHGGRGGRDGRGRSQGNSIQRVCAEVGAPLGGKTFGEAHGPSSLSETQTKELKAACEKLATAAAAQRTADEAASKTFQEQLASDHKKLDEACPALTEHHEFGSWHDTELSTACKEAFNTYGAAAHEAQKAYRGAVEEAGKTFQKALGEFETSTKPIFEALAKTAESERPGPSGGRCGASGSGGGWAGSQHGF